MIQLLDLKGTDYEIGLQLGKHFKQSINSRISEFDKLLENEEMCTKLINISKKIEVECKESLDEIYGRADGANVNRQSMLLMFLPELYDKKVGCTTVISKDNDHICFAHNEDDKNYKEEDVAIVKYNYGKDWVVGYVLCDRLLGTTAGYNSKGIVHSSNYIAPDNQDENNISRYVLSKKLVRMGSVKEIEEYLEKIQVSSPFSFNALDLNTNEVVNYEKDLNKLYKKIIVDKYARSNHFILKESKLLTASENTKYRYERSNKLISELDLNKINLDDLFNILNDSTDDPIYSINVKNETLFTLGIDNQNKMVNMINHFSEEVIKFNYNEFKSN